MTEVKIKDLFANDISRRIEEVVKVDQNDQEIIRDEISEYVVTNSIREHMVRILESYSETRQKPHEGIAIWVSGFFGSGKSSFAKYLGLALENRDVCGNGAASLLGQRVKDQKLQVLLNNITENIPTEAVIFDVSTDRGIRTGNQSITEIMYRLFLQSLGYAKDLDLSELEITLEEDGRLAAFKETYQSLFKKDWDKEKGKIALAVQQASRVMNTLDSATYPTADSWRESALKRADITPGDLAKRGMELMARRHPNKSLLFVVDEVGQFVARDVQKMLDLQAVVQNLGRIGRGKMWVMVTSQEKLTELVGGLDDKRVELARLMDRFPQELQVHLEPADISEVTSKRVLSKNANAEKSLRELFNDHRGRLSDQTRLTADIKLQELTAENFIDLYPLLPYQIDLIIQVVSGLRTQGGASKHVGGANRTIIKLAQQLLIHPDVNLAESEFGALARIDQIYDLVSGNIGSEIRGKIDDIGAKIDHHLAQSVAKSICLLQYVRSIHRTAENISSTLHLSVGADSRLPEVRSALEALERAHMVRLGDDGYRIPSPAEDDWERQRASLSPKPGDVSRLHTEIITNLWQPQPQHSFLDVKTFKAGLFIGGRMITSGDIPIHLTLSEVGNELSERIEESRKRSQTEDKSIFWAAALDESIDRETVELFRSKEILSRKERGAQTKDETALVAEEKVRLRRHQDELRRLIKQSLLSGVIFFRGNDRSPDESSSDIGRTAAKVLAQALPEVFDRFKEASARVSKKDLDSLMTSENLRGLTPLFSELNLVRDQEGKAVFDIDNPCLSEVLARIKNRASYGDPANGRFLADEFGKEPFGWDFEVIRIFVVALIRSGKLEATSKSNVIESALTLDAKNTFSNNNLFKQASFRPREVIAFEHVVDAADNFRKTFGKEVSELEQGVVARSIRKEILQNEKELQDTYTTLIRHQLPGADSLRSALDEMNAIQVGKEDRAILNFNSSFNKIREAIKRGAELSQSLTDGAIYDLGKARDAINKSWHFLETEQDIDSSFHESAKKLADILEKETFFREFADIDKFSRKLKQEFQRRHEEAVEDRVASYNKALETLQKTPGWLQLNDGQRQRISAPLVTRTDRDAAKDLTIPLLRSECLACGELLDKAIESILHQIDGDRVVRVPASSYFSGGIETEEQLDQAISGLKDECLELIGAGKKVLIK